jgi:hypothetical protein
MIYKVSDKMLSRLEFKSDAAEIIIGVDENNITLIIDNNRSYRWDAKTGKLVEIGGSIIDDPGMPNDMAKHVWNVR